ncbi:MAG: hypothetical protein ACXWP1_00875 [Bdellovibrionota bacterium]
MSDQPKTPHRRSLRNIRFMKGSRLRLVFVLMTAGMIFSCVMLVNVMHNLDRGLSRIPTVDPALKDFVEQTHDTLTGVLAMGLVLNLVSAALALLFGLLVSHLFYGPLIPLTRQWRELKEGRFAARVRLRPEDELRELMKEQNELAEALEAKFGSANR